MGFFSLSICIKKEKQNAPTYLAIVLVMLGRFGDLLISVLLAFVPRKYASHREASARFNSIYRDHRQKAGVYTHYVSQDRKWVGTVAEGETERERESAYVSTIVGAVLWR